MRTTISGTDKSKPGRMECPAEPWEPEAWHEQEIAIQRRLLSTAKILPREMADLEIKQMVRVGGGQYLAADDPTLVKHEGATLVSQPSSSAAPASSVEPMPAITKREIMGHTVFKVDYCPVQGEAGDDIDDYGPDFISVVKGAPEYEPYDKTWLIGVIRGAKRTPLRFEGP